MRCCNSASSFRRASACAATRRSSMISRWSDLSSESSTCALLSSPLPESFNVSSPPPAVPSTSRRSSSACIASIFDLSSAACFMRPKKSAIAILLCFVLGAGGLAKRIERRLVYRAGRARSRAHFDNLGAGKARKDRLHKRVAAHVVLELGFAILRLRVQAGLALLGGNDDHPAPSGPVAQLAREFARERPGRARFEAELQPAVLETHEAHIAFERALDRKIAFLGGQS